MRGSTLMSGVLAAVGLVAQCWQTTVNTTREVPRDVVLDLFIHLGNDDSGIIGVNTGYGVTTLQTVLAALPVS